MRTFALSVALTIGIIAQAGTHLANRAAATGSFQFDLLRTHYKFDRDGSSYREVTARIRILDENGVRSWHQLTFDYRPFSERLEILHIRVQGRDGSREVATGEIQRPKLPKDMQDFYDEQRITLPSLSPGDVIEYDVRIVTESPSAPGQFWMTHRFSSSNVLDERLEVEVPRTRQVKTRAASGAKAWVTEEKAFRTYHWSPSSTLFSGRIDTGLPGEQVPDVQLTSFANWEEVGRWYARVEESHRLPSEEIRTKAKELTKGLDSDLEKVKALYNFTAKKIKYITLISLGIGGYEPRSAEDTLHKGAGDCKDKTALLEALLGADGIRASSVLISPNRELDMSLPSPWAFNHVMTTVAIGRDEIWMDPSSQVMPFGMLGYAVRARQGLVIPPGGDPHFSQTPSEAPIPSSRTEEIDGKIAEDGSLDIKVTITATGDAALPLREAFLAPVESVWPLTVRSIVKGTERGDHLNEVRITPPTETDVPFTISFRLSRTGVGSKNRHDPKLPLPLFDLPLPPAETMTGTQYLAPGLRPFRIGVPSKYIYHARLELGASLGARIPPPTTLRRAYADYHAEYRLTSNMLQAEYELVTRRDKMPAAAARDYEAFRNQVLGDEASGLAWKVARSAND